MELKFMYDSYASEILLGAKYSISIEISNTHAQNAINYMLALSVVNFV